MELRLQTCVRDIASTSDNIDGSGIRDICVSPTQFDGSPLEASREIMVMSTKRNTTSRHMLLSSQGARLDRPCVCIMNSDNKL